MDIAPEKVGYIILRAREYASSFNGWSSSEDEGGMRGDAIQAIENQAVAPETDEVAEFIRNLNEDEQISLVVLAWIGRGSHEITDWDRAVATARRERTTETDKYLLGMPLLPDYLEDGLEAMGYSIEDLGDGLL